MTRRRMRQLVRTRRGKTSAIVRLVAVDVRCNRPLDFEMSAALRLWQRPSLAPGPAIGDTGAALMRTGTLMQDGRDLGPRK